MCFYCIDRDEDGRCDLSHSYVAKNYKRQKYPKWTKVYDITSFSQRFVW